jgi:hypothetical protein
MDPVSETSCFYSQEHRTMEKVQNPSNSVCYTPSSELYKIYVWTFNINVMLGILGVRMRGGWNWFGNESSDRL